RKQRGDFRRYPVPGRYVDRHGPGAEQTADAQARLAEVILDFRRRTVDWKLRLRPGARVIAMAPPMRRDLGQLLLRKESSQALVGLGRYGGDEIRDSMGRTEACELLQGRCHRHRIV